MQITDNNMSISLPYAPLMPELNNGTIEHFVWQQRAIDEIVAAFKADTKHRGHMLRSPCRTGKTYMIMRVIRRMMEEGLLQRPEGSINPFPVLYIVPKTVIIQCQRVAMMFGVAHLIMFKSYGEMTTNGGMMFLNWITKTLPNGDPYIYPEWKPEMRPAFVVIDECQKVKNPESSRSKVIRYLPENVRCLFASASPWQRVADARAFIEAAGVVTRDYNRLPATQYTAPAILRDIARPKSPDDYSPSACERLREQLDNYITETRNIRYKFQPATKCTVIDFASPESAARYQAAYNEWIEELRKIRNDPEFFHYHPVIRIWVSNQKFMQAAEKERAPILAQIAIDRVRNGRQVIISSNFIETLRIIWRELKEHGMDMSRVAYLSSDMSQARRQEQVDRFQRGEADIIIFCKGVGGEGISLHHDRPTTRPRTILLPMVWSAVDLVQILGRSHGPTSLSSTQQEILWFRNTVESEKVMPRVATKLKCINKSVTAKEQFIGLFERQGDVTDDELREAGEEFETQVRQHVDKSEDDSASDDDEGITGEGLENAEDYEAMPVGYN